MAVQLSKEDFDELSRIAAHLPQFTEVRGRQQLVVDALKGSDHTYGIVSSINFAGASLSVARHIVGGLAQHGRIDTGSEALGVFIEYLVELAANTLAEGLLTKSTQELLDETTYLPFLRGLLQRYPWLRVEQTQYPSFTDFGGTAHEFANRLISRLKDVEFPTGTPALVTVLRDVQPYLAENRRGEVNRLLKRWRVAETSPVDLIPDPPIVKTNPIDNAEMIYIPAGDFLMGDDDQSDNPRRKVTLSGYYIYKNPVTVAQYRLFCEQSRGKQKMPDAPSWGWIDDHPIVNVNWQESKAYCEWAGGSLPSEAQWEKAARGTDGRKYPWGDEWDNTKCANSAGNHKLRSTQPVGSYPLGASPYGVLDMSGNVWEWCLDAYDANHQKSVPQNNTVNARSNDNSAQCVRRGGSWFIYNTDWFRSSYRFSTPAYQNNFIGFRFCLPEP